MVVMISRTTSIHFFLLFMMAISVFAQDADRRSLIERAKKEGELIWYTTAGLQDSKPMADEFQKDYPFIKPSVVRAGSGVLVNKILNEARAQKVFFDVFNTNHESILPLKKARLDQPLRIARSEILRRRFARQRRLLALPVRLNPAKVSGKSAVVQCRSVPTYLAGRKILQSAARARKSATKN